MPETPSLLASLFQRALRYAAGVARLALVLLLALAAVPSAAHPGHETAVYHYLELRARPRELALEYVASVGGLLSQAVWSQIDTDGDGRLEPQEQARHARELADALTLTVRGSATPWKLESLEYPSRTQFFAGSFPEGVIRLRLTAPLPPVSTPGEVVALRVGTFPHFKGVFAEPSVRADGMEASHALISEEGRLIQVRLKHTGLVGKSGPAEILREAQSEVPGEPTRLRGLRLPSEVTAPLAAPVAGPRAAANDPFARIDLANAPVFQPGAKVLYAAPGGARDRDANTLKGYLKRPLSLGLVLLALGAAVIAGAAHALTPGHGKTMVAAYLVGSRGTVWDAVLLGLTVTLTHTGSVYLLGLVCLWLTTRIQAEVVSEWLGVFSGLLVLGMGFWLFQRGLLAYHGLRPLPGHAHGPGGHTHDAPAHEHEHGHDHGRPNGRREHSHAHEHSHSNGGSHTHAVDAEPASGAEAASATRRPPTDSPLDDYHGSDAAPPGPLRNRWGIIGLGIAGGMVPCTDALAILLAAVNLGSIVFGLSLILAFSVGMAMVLVAIGVVMVRAKHVMQRFTGETRWVKALPAVSGAILFCLGAWLTLQALGQAGVVHIG
jgi:nickel/cobalt exporter